MTPSPIRVLVVEDDPSVAAGLVRGLRRAGFEVELATDGANGRDSALLGRHDVVVLDLMLPEQSGFEVLRDIQGRTAAPVIVLTARTELEDRLRSFDLGASDFVAKPFFVEELVARIKSVLRIRELAPKRVVEWAGVSLDLDARVATAEGREIRFTRFELDLLLYLVDRPGRAISRRQLAENAGVPSDERAERTVDSHIARIRRKLGPRAAARIATVWGIGYRFDEAEANEER